MRFAFLGSNLNLPTCAIKLLGPVKHQTSRQLEVLRPATEHKPVMFRGASDFCSFIQRLQLMCHSAYVSFNLLEVISLHWSMKSDEAAFNAQAFGAR
jgi:hypothetical protein